MVRRWILAAALSTLIIGVPGTRTFGAGAPPASLRPASGSGVPSDFNGDGFADLAMPFFGEDVGSVVDAGAVEVLYGASGSGLQANGVGGPDDQFWTQDSPGVRDRAEPGDEFGWAVFPGDFNGDGYADLAIGVPFEDVGSVRNAGAVEVLYGSARGLQATSPDDRFWTRDSSGVKGRAGAGDAFGRSLSAADFNGDGYADLAVGNQRAAVRGLPEAGGAEVLYGSPRGLQATSPDDQYWTQDVAGVADRAEPHDWFGRSVGAGDFNGDGYADLAIGAPFEDLGRITDAGAAEILFGSPRGLQTTDPAAQYWTQNLMGLGLRARAKDQFGRSFAAGDFDGDGFDDLAISVRKEDVASQTDAGAVEVLYGSATGLQKASPRSQFWTQDSPGVPDRAEPGDVFGREVQAGDLNGDGFADLAVAAPFEDVGSARDAGGVNVLFGSAAEGLQANGVGGPKSQFWTQDSPGVPDSAESGDSFGARMAIADFNADGVQDLAIEAPFEDVGRVRDAGAWEVLYGSPAGPQVASPPAQLWTQDSRGVKDRTEPGDGGYMSKKPAQHRLKLILFGVFGLLLVLAAGAFLVGLLARRGPHGRDASPARPSAARPADRRA